MKFYDGFFLISRTRSLKNTSCLLAEKKKISKDFLFIKLKAFSTCWLYTPIAYGIPVPEEEILKGNSEWTHLDSLMVSYLVLIFLSDNTANLDKVNFAYISDIYIYIFTGEGVIWYGVSNMKSSSY